jgi:DNA-binding response OmpR family regulator
MTAIHLLIPDVAPAELTLVIVDEAAVDAKIIKKLMPFAHDKSVILLLGAVPEATDENLFTEIFPKPLRLGHLLARLHFYSEIAPKLRSAPMLIGTYHLHAQQRSMTQGDAVIRLTEKETGLLEYLAQSPNSVGREELLANVWGYDARIDTHTLETHVYQLRRKLGNEVILNENGLYRLVR